jgi:hypothetical protein
VFKYTGRGEYDTIFDLEKFGGMPHGKKYRKRTLYFSFGTSKSDLACYRQALDDWKLKKDAIDAEIGSLPKPYQPEYERVPKVKFASNYSTRRGKLLLASDYPSRSQEITCGTKFASSVATSRLWPVVRSPCDSTCDQRRCSHSPFVTSRRNKSPLILPTCTREAVRWPAISVLGERRIAPGVWTALNSRSIFSKP